MLKNLRLTNIVLALVFLAFNLGALARSYVIIIPSYNNNIWWRENIDSALNLETIPGQIDYRIIYIDDCSTDGTGEAVEQYIKDWRLSSGSQLDIKIIHNEIRRGAMSNWYRAIHSCRDDEVVVSLDGDDRLAHKQVLLRLEQEYIKGCWLTYGQYVRKSGKEGNNNLPISTNLIIRKQQFTFSHLRTFYAGLFKQIKLIDFFNDDDKFYVMACDVALMIPMLEMCAPHAVFIYDILYIYNDINAIGDSIINHMLQEEIEAKIKHHKVYSPIKTYTTNLNSNIKYKNINQNNYKQKFKEQYVMINLSNNLKNDISAEEIKLLQQTNLPAIIVGKNFDAISNSELIKINKNVSVYATRSQNLILDKLDYIFLTRKFYKKLLNQPAFKTIDKFNDFIIKGLIQREDLILYEVIM